jgi:hypothetical protein
MPQADIVAVLTKVFNAQADDVRSTLHKYGASLKPISDAKACYAVDGVAEEKAAAFLQEFRKLKGVRVAYIDPPDSYL